MTRLTDTKNYQNASHDDFIKLARSLVAMPLGDLLKLHRDKAAELGATAPSPVFIKGVIFTRMVTGKNK